MRHSEAKQILSEVTTCLAERRKSKDTNMLKSFSLQRVCVRSMISFVAKSCGKMSFRRSFLWAVWGPVKDWHHRSKPTDAGSTPMSVGLSAGYMLEAPDYNSCKCDEIHEHSAFFSSRRRRLCGVN